MSLGITFPRPVTALHQIEISSRCNLVCPWCPHQSMKRVKYDMDRPTYERCLKLARRFVQSGTQDELNLAGIGESTLHHDFADYLYMARATLGPYVKLTVATNGLIVRPEITKAFQDNKVQVFVSLHDQSKAVRAVEAYKHAGVLIGLSVDPSTFPNNWAGQIEWPSWSDHILCRWVTYGWAMASSMGDVLSCCLDAHGTSKIGTIWQDGDFFTQPHSLCKSCYQDIEVTGYQQGNRP